MSVLKVSHESQSPVGSSGRPSTRDAAEWVAIGGKPRLSCLGFAKATTDDVDFRPISDAAIEIDDIAAAHANAAIGYRVSEIPPLRGAMDVDVSWICVFIVGFETTEPEDARYNRIAARGIRLEHFARGFATFENGTARMTIANFSRDLHAAEGRPMTSRLVAEAVFRSGNFVCFDGLAVRNQQHALIFDADDDFIAVVPDAGDRPASRERDGGDAAEEER